MHLPTDKFRFLVCFFIYNLAIAYLLPKTDGEMQLSNLVNWMGRYGASPPNSPLMAVPL
uniref:Uncharacterized protein n=1 Tax=Anguilla anguilla TaxID=7936 RepID=A0A0E9WFY2_ANGAN